MYHALAILATGLIAARLGGWLIVAAGWRFTAGILLFSGSLYLLAFTGVTMLGAITPIGGVRVPPRLGLPRPGGCLA